MIRNTISSIEGLVSGTLGSTVIKEVAQSSHEEKENLPYILSTIFILNIIIVFIISIFIFFRADFIVEKFLLNNTNLINALYIGIFILITTTFSTLMQNILIGLEEFKKLATLSIITSTLSIPTILLLIYFFKFYGALFGVVFYFGFDFIIKYFYYKKLNISSEFNIDKFKDKSKKILLFSTPLLITIIINSFTFWYARILIINETNSFSNIAIFDAAFQWLTVIMIITGATTSVALTMLSKVSVENEKDSRKIFILNLIVNFFIAFFISIIFISFSKQIMGLYGENYLVGILTLKILAVLSIFFTLSSLINKFIIVNSNVYIIPLSSIIASFFFIF
jgi:O-antigen/teichoic acid export membrane protein